MLQQLGGRRVCDRIGGIGDGTLKERPRFVGGELHGAPVVLRDGEDRLAV
jgi:hypothetical protein